MGSGLAYLTFCVLKNEDLLCVEFVTMKMKQNLAEAAMNGSVDSWCVI
jgi:hypothetical protein